MIVSKTSTPQLTARTSFSNGSSRGQNESMNTIFGSRKSSTDNSVIFYSANGSLKANELSQSLQKLDYDSYPAIEIMNDDISDALDNESDLSYISTTSTNEHEFYKKASLLSLTAVEQQLNVDSASSYNSQSDNENSSMEDHSGEFKFAYLVENIKQSKDGFGDDDKEYLFLYLEPPYLLEKSDDGKMRNKLDLNYLICVECSRETKLTIILRFDLMREDWKYRKYIFEQAEPMEMFYSILLPIVNKNLLKKKEEIVYSECLKCEYVFAKRDDTMLCISCGSNMVIDKDTHLDQHDSNLTHNNVDAATDLSMSTSNKINITKLKTNDSKSDIYACSLPSNLNNNDTEYGQLDLSRSLTETFHNSLLIPFKDNNSNLSSNEDDKDIVCDDIKNEMDKEVATIGRFSDTSVSSRRTSTDSKLSKQSENQNFESLLNKIHYTNISSTSSLRSNSENGSSKEHVRRSDAPYPKVSTPISKKSVKGSSLIDYGEYLKCNHRLKLYLSMNIYSGDESFLCQIRCNCAMYNKLEVFDCILNISTKSVYVFLISDANSESPEECLKKQAFCPIQMLHAIHYGYFHQSFLMEFTKSSCHFKFLTCDDEQTEKFLDIVKEKLSDLNILEKEIFHDACNVEVISNIRSSVIGLKESVIEIGRRLYQEITLHRKPELLKNRKMRIRSYQQCFVSKELVDWLLSRCETKTRLEGVELGQQLLHEGLISNVNKDQQEFVDNDAWYRFNPLAMEANMTKDDDNTVNDKEEKFDESECKEISSNVQKYLFCDLRINETDSTFHSRTLIATDTHIYTVEECHQWPLSKLHAPPSLLRKQFVTKESWKITSITSMECYEDAPCYCTIYFIDEESPEDSCERTWMIKTNTPKQVEELCDYIKNLWENLFAIDFTTNTHSCVQPFLDIDGETSVTE